MEWFTTRLHPNLPPKTAIVVDNASYHDKQKDKPSTKSSTKKAMKQWLDEHNVTCGETDLKRNLSKKIQMQ